MSTSEQQMATDFTTAIKSKVETWAKETPAIDPETQKQIKALKDAAAKLQGVDDSAAKSLTDKADALEPKLDEAHRKRQIAFALVTSAKGLGLQVVLNKNTQKALSGASSTGTGAGKRIDPATMKAGIAYLLDKAPESKGDAVTKDELKLPSLTDEQFKSVWTKATNTEGYLARAKGSRLYYLSEKGLKAK